jgi:alpha-glucosidase
MRHFTIGAAMALVLAAGAAVAQTDPNAVAQIPTASFKPVATATSPDGTHRAHHRLR